MNKLERALVIVDRTLNTIETLVLLVTGVLLVSSLFYAAVVRYTHLGSFPEETELSWLLYSWMVFIGSSSVLRGGDHPRVEILPRKLGWKYKIVIYVVSIIYLASIIYILVNYRWLYSVQKTAVMRLSLIYFYDAVIVGYSFMIVRYVIKIFNLVKTRGRG